MGKYAWASRGRPRVSYLASLAFAEPGRWRLINPLNIRFSQPRIAPHFRARRLAASVPPLRTGISSRTRQGRRKGGGVRAVGPQVFEAPLQDRAYAGAAAEDALDGVPSYDLAGSIR